MTETPEAPEPSPAPPPPPPPMPPEPPAVPQGYPAQGYPTPGYPTQGYSTPGYPTYGQPGYPPPGYPPAPYGRPPYGYPPQTSGRAVAVLVLGITSLVLLCGYGVGVIPAIIALALAPGARREMNASGGRIVGDGLLKAGVICSWVAVGLTIVGVIVVVLFFVALGLGSTASDPGFADTLIRVHLP